MLDKDFTNKNVFSTKQVIIILVFSISITFSAAMIYAEFVLMRSNIETIEQRADKREKRNNYDRAAIWAEINKMKDEHK